MIKYAIVVPGVPDKDGQFSIGIRVTKQDEDQTAVSGVGNLVFKAKNGWSVISGRTVEIKAKKKVIVIMGAYGTGTYTNGLTCQKANEDVEYLDSKEEAEKVREDIIEAINEWVVNGGFDKIQVQGDLDGEMVQENFTAEYKYEVKDYYQGE